MVVLFSPDLKSKGHILSESTRKCFSLASINDEIIKNTFGIVPCPVGLKEGRVVNDGGEKGREAPQQQGGEELSDDGVLEEQTQRERREVMSDRTMTPIVTLYCDMR